jgi:hypothetical protein
MTYPQTLAFFLWGCKPHMFLAISDQCKMSTIITDVNFNETKAKEINVCAWVFTGIAIGTVFLKLTTRAHVKKLGWDDFFIFLSLVRGVCLY